MNYIDYLYESGDLPERYYNQLNGKTAQENYIRILRERDKKDSKNLFPDIEKSLNEVINTALNDILKHLNAGN